MLLKGRQCCGRLLDAGCGTGGMLAAINRNFDECFGFDSSETAVRLCRSRGVGGLSLASVCLMPFRDEEFDVVLCLDVLCLRGIDIARALSEIRRVLKQGGIVILNLPAFQSLKSHHDELVDIERRFTRGEVMHFLRARGFEVLAEGYWNTFLFPVAALLRWMDRRFIRGEKRLSDLRPLPSWLNSILAKLVVLEAAMATRVRFPFGLSVFCAARRTG